MAIDVLDIIGGILFPIPLFVYYFVFKSQQNSITKENSLLVIFCLRACSLLPIFSAFVYIVLLVPGSAPYIGVFQAIIEGYAVYCFFTFMVANVGGPKRAIQVIRTSERTCCCCKFQQNNPENCYIRTQYSIWQFLVVRPFITFIAAVGYFLDKDMIFTLFTALTGLSTICMVRTFIFYYVNFILYAYIYKN